MSSIMKPIVSTTITLYIEELLEAIDKIIADYQFQSKTRWTLEDRQKFMESVIVNMAPSKFIFADTSACLATSSTEEDKKYYQMHNDNGVSYLNIDSNNRVTSIGMFVEGEFTLRPAKYQINGTVYNIVAGENDSYETMPTALRIAFNNSIITIEKVTEATRSQLSDLFIRLNDGCPLNAAEKRNAIISDVANVIRTLGEKYETSMEGTKLFTSYDITRRKFDEFIGACALLYFGDRNSLMTPKTFEEMYDSTSEFQSSIGSFKTRFTDFMKLVKEDAPDLGYKNALLDLFVFYDELRSEGYVIDKDNEKNFIDAFKSAHANALADNTDIEYETGRKATYVTLLRNRKYIKYRMRVISEKGFNPTEYGTKLAPQRTADKKTRIIANERDGGLTYEGKEVQRGRLLTGDYEAGHKVPYIKGGTVDASNTVMQTKEDNRKTGTRELV